MIPQGIHPWLGMAEYHDWRIDKQNLLAGPISCSMLKAFAPSPYAWLHGPEREQTKCQLKGTILDAALTDPDRLDDLVPFELLDLSKFDVAPFDSFRSKAAKEYRKEAEQSGRTVITQSTLDKLIEENKADNVAIGEKRAFFIKAANAARSHKIAGALLDGAQFQVGVIGEIAGIPAKALLDILPAKREMIVDYKTISTGLDDKSIRDAIGKFKYHWQGAFYRTLFNKVSTDRHVEQFALIFQDVNTLEVRVEVLSADAMQAGGRSVKIALDEFIKCAHHGIRSRYADTMGTVELMPYHAMAEEDWNIAMEGGQD